MHPAVFAVAAAMAAVGITTVATPSARGQAAAAAESTGGTEVAPRPPVRLMADQWEHFIAISADGGALYIDGGWDTAFGGSIGIGRIGQGGALPFWAVSVGLVGNAERGGGRAFAELHLGRRDLLGLLLGVSAGPALELDDVRPPDPGGQIALWLQAGVVPYLRLGYLRDAGGFVDAGVRIAFPTFRF